MGVLNPPATAVDFATGNPFEGSPTARGAFSPGALGQAYNVMDGAPPLMLLTPI
jgi:hypothetical protein